MKRTLIAVAVVLAGFPALARAHAGNNGANIVHACVGNISKVARIVGVAGTCISGPPPIAETAMHWPLTSGAAQTQLDTLQALVTTLQGQVAALQAGLPAETAARQAADITLQTNIDAEAAARATADINLQTQIDNLGGGGVPQSLLDLAPYVSVDLNTINDLTGPHVIFSGANVHVRNALGATNGNPGNPASLNPPDIVTDGLGNLIVGYNENFVFLGPGGSPGFPRSGSHNLLVGNGHGFTGFGGFLAGRQNQSLGSLTSVSGGTRNVASGFSASVSGGEDNSAIGVSSSVSGGQSNRASGNFASVSGGVDNFAAHTFSAVSGGASNIASGFEATVSGGVSNVASGGGSTVSGGTGLTNAADGTEVP